MCEKLVDSLSPYFSTSSEKRRTTQKGEFAQLHSGKSRSERSPLRSPPQSPSGVAREVKFEEAEPVSPSKQQMSSTSTRGRRAVCELQPVVGGRGTQNSASAALFSSPSSKGSAVQRDRSSSKSLSPPVKRVRTPKLPHTPQGSPRKSRGGGRRRSSCTKVGMSTDETTEEDGETTGPETSEREGQVSV
ncbi:hypothetical protein Q1695_005659 [Nippostrongylus brasiliensis]|nr:hypothetical protein Q1695_005659 [Nippostrongylus brasiliensis]